MPYGSRLSGLSYPISPKTKKKRKLINLVCGCCAPFGGIGRANQKYYSSFIDSCDGQQRSRGIVRANLFDEPGDAFIGINNSARLSHQWAKYASFHSVHDRHPNQLQACNSHLRCCNCTEIQYTRDEWCRMWYMWLQCNTHARMGRII